MSKNEAKQDRNLEVELLNEKLKNLEHQIKKPQSSEEAFHARVQAYEAKQAERENLMREIETRRMKIWAENPKMRQDEVLLLEAWERRIREVENKNPEFAAMLKFRIREKIKEVNADTSR